MSGVQSPLTEARLTLAVSVAGIDGEIRGKGLGVVGVHAANQVGFVHRVVVVVVGQIGIVALVVAVIFRPRRIGIHGERLFVAISPVDDGPREINPVDELALGVALLEQPIVAGRRHQRLQETEHHDLA